jgi:SAM-dependent methyltransferase
VNEWQARGRSFGSVARDYERYRPGYGPEVARLALAGLGPPAGLRALESGAGTGKATRVFAAFGLDLTAVEPDPEMAAVLSAVVPRPLPPGRLEIVTSSLEGLEPRWWTTPFDLVYAAAAWHWVDDTTRWERAAALLRPGGVFASFGGTLEVEDEELAEQVESWWPDVPHIRAGRPPSAETAAEEPAMLWPGDELLRSPYFTAVEEHAVPSTLEWPAADYLGMLTTVSDFRIVSPQEREDRLGRIAALLPDPVLLRRDLRLHRAVRTEHPAVWPGA